MQDRVLFSGARRMPTAATRSDQSKERIVFSKRGNAIAALLVIRPFEGSSQDEAASSPADAG